MPHHTPPPNDILFEEEFVSGLKKVFEEMIVFNQLLGLKITSLKPERVTARIDMRNDLVGHFAYNRLHGGVISAGLDAMGGLAVMVAIGARHMDETPTQRLQRFSKLGTIDLRVDYLRPGIGEWFELALSDCRSEIYQLHIKAEVRLIGAIVAHDLLIWVPGEGSRHDNVESLLESVCHHTLDGSKDVVLGDE